jgi:hypothetical protein
LSTGSVGIGAFGSVERAVVVMRPSLNGDVNRNNSSHQ